MEAGSEKEREREMGKLSGEMEKQEKVYSQSSQFGVGLEEKLREELESVSVQTTAEKQSETVHHCKDFTGTQRGRNTQ